MAEKVEKKDEPKKAESSASAAAKAAEAGGKKKTVPEEIEQYRLNKMKALSQEKGEMMSKLFVVKGQKGFYKLFGDSGILYACYLCPKMGKRPPIIHADKDKLVGADASFSRNKVVIFKNMDVFRKVMDFFDIRLKYSKNGLFEYTLPKALEREFVRKLELSEDEKWKQANEQLMPEHVWPAYFKTLSELQRDIYFTALKCNPTERMMFMDDMVETISQMMTEYVKMANGWEGMKPKEYKAFAIEAAHHLRAAMMVMLTIQSVDRSAAARIARKMEVIEGKAINAKI